ncbi:extracellular solute-binding protein [Cohnella endophytica]|uniref:Extracellular solute-binding protein n=1 Tax=Cohnella endophytica TaxID=2419778 RepID=A0A494X355_9BACL|nr:extracellular solute-binding protein [Cohnella endophytica]RKP44792.1 extracellular solute-binding protein [Cohnella endophytica]
MKKLLLTLLTTSLVTALALAGCGKNEAGNSSASPSGSAVESASQSAGNESPSASDDKPFKLRISGWFLTEGEGTTDAFKKIVEEKFKEKYPNGSIQWDNLTGEKYFDKLKAELASSAAADIIYSQQVPSLGKAGYLMDLSGEPLVNDMVDATKIVEAYDGKIYGAATTIQSFGFYYNKKIFADLGIAPPKTFNELLAAGEKLNAAKITPITVGFKDQWTLDYFFGGYAQLAEALTSSTFEADVYKGTQQLDGPETKSAVDKFTQLAQKNMFNKSALSIDWPQTQIEFASGKAAMINQGPWMAQVAQETFETKGFEPFEVGFFPLSDENGKVIMGVGPDHSVSINAKTEHPQEAKDLLSIILSPEVNAVHAGDGGMSGMKSTIIEAKLPAMKELIDVLNNNPTTYQWGAYYPPSVKTGLLNLVTKIIGGGKAGGGELDEVTKNYEKDKSLIILP